MFLVIFGTSFFLIFGSVMGSISGSFRDHFRSDLELDVNCLFQFTVYRGDGPPEVDLKMWYESDIFSDFCFFLFWVPFWAPKLSRNGALRLQKEGPKMESNI